MRSINLSAWAIEHPSMVVFLMVMLLVLGTLSYFTLGRDEEPPFVFRAMIVSALVMVASKYTTTNKWTDESQLVKGTK
jgi:multidrug efflux pump subunit AcrB